MYTNGTTTISGKKIVVDGCVILNPTREQLQEAGWREIQPYQPSEEELQQQAIQQEIEDLKYQLSLTDYIALKAIEGYDCDTLYPNWKENRKALRDRINELEDGGVITINQGE